MDWIMPIDFQTAFFDSVSCLSHIFKFTNFNALKICSKISQKNQFDYFQTAT